MNKEKLTNLIRGAIVKKLKELGVNKFKEFKTINQVPELSIPLVDLLSKDFPQFVKDIEWVSPQPRSFRVVLENEQMFYLTDLTRSWVAEVEGRKYYLLNLAELQNASKAITRVLRYAKPLPQLSPQEELGLGPENGGVAGGGEPATFPGQESPDLATGAEEAPEDIAPGFEEFEELPS